MATLTRIAYYTRRGVVFGVIGFISFFIFKALLGFGFKYWRETHPAPTPSPTVLFGKLPKLTFPLSEYSYPQKFILETIGGELPSATASAKVYQIPKKLPSLLASRHAQQFANRLGFEEPPVSKTATEYQYEDKKVPLRSLDLNIVYFNFSLKYDFLKDPNVFELRPPSPQEAETYIQSFFDKTNVFPVNVREGETKVSFLRFAGDKLLPATSLSKADAVRVDFLRKEVDQLAILPPGFEKGSTFAILSGATKEEKKIIEAQLNFFAVDWQTAATYPIKTANQAWEELKQGKGFIARWLPGYQQVVVRDAYLAYYDPPEYQSYLLPIFVFEGDQDFVAYVSAVKDEWLE